MKKLLALVTVLLLICGSCLAESSVAQLIADYGLEPVNYDASAGYTLDYSVDSNIYSTITWSDSDGTWLASGETATVAEAYLAALDMEPWESCRYTVGNKARISYGAKSGQQLSTLTEYKDAVAKALGITVDETEPEASEADVRDYVLNTNSKKFHKPTCDSVKKMKPKNRKDYTGTRDDLIAQGYEPCGSCNP